MNVAKIIVTGDELVAGSIPDTNTQYLAHQMVHHGIKLAGMELVDDDAASIRAALERASDAQLVVTTGGLGPTHDDRTAEAVAAFAQRELQIDPVALQWVEARVAQLSKARGIDPAPYAEANRKQALLPSGAVPLQPAGTAPGFVLDHGGRCIVVLPGPPTEMQFGWQRAIEHAAVAGLLGDTVAHTRLVRVWSAAESEVVKLLTELGHSDSDRIRITICARYGELEVSIRGSDAVRCDMVAEALRQHFATRVFATDDERPTEKLVLDSAVRLGLRLATAESCTGGLLGARLTSVDGASEAYLGGVVAYDNAVKWSQLDVSERALSEYGAVSEQVAIEMAEGARSRLSADCAVSITGVAGPGGGTEDKPVGLVWIGCAAQGAGATARRYRFPGGREDVRIRSAVAALHELRIALER